MGDMSDKVVESSTEDDNSVTMLDVLQVENQLEEDAYAVLGASDDQNCTYNKVVYQLTHYLSFDALFLTLSSGFLEMYTVTRRRSRHLPRNLDG